MSTGGNARSGPSTFACANLLTGAILTAMATTTTRRRLTGPMSQRLRTARVNAGYTQQEIADLTGMSLKSVNNYENARYAGNRKAIYVRAWAGICGPRVQGDLGRPHTL